MAAKKLTFEQAMQELKEISAKMSEKDISLDSSMEYYKRAVELISFCKDYLDKATLTVKNLNQVQEAE